MANEYSPVLETPQEQLIDLGDPDPPLLLSHLSSIPRNSRTIE